MTETYAAGWYVCYSDDVKRKTWHYFAVGELRSLCGIASGYQRSIGEVQRADGISWFTLNVARTCQQCDRVRRPLEGRGEQPQRKARVTR